MSSKSKRVLLICPYPIGRAPSQRFRFEQYLDYLESEGFEITIKPFLDQPTWDLLYKKGLFLQKTIGMLKSTFKRFWLLNSVKKYDFIFMHREAMQFGPPVIEYILTKVLKKKILYDFDDAIWLKNHSDSNAILSFTKWYSKVKSISAWVDTVQCGNAYLAKFTAEYNNNVHIIPTTIDTIGMHNQSIDYNRKKLTIGWTGSHSTMHYLDMIYPVLERLEKKYDFNFLVISDRKPDVNLKSLVYCKWDKINEIDDLSKIDIGVMPLRNNQWSEGKCAFKGLQYMSLGIPTVMSPVGVNNSLIQNNENGYLVDSDEEWYNTLAHLLESQTDRERIGKNGDITVEKFYSVVATKEKYLALFNSMLN
jgi:glycosyltransferase involved in cell wall biosynthesis